ncbi:MAG: hypothetical protein FJ137_05995 [Deltaproteobacteria bacterium]|nr:hypothetical protein [Deltaproteobacteria bacterium]
MTVVLDDVRRDGRRRCPAGVLAAALALGAAAAGCAPVLPRGMRAAGDALLAPAPTTSWAEARDEATRRVEVYDVLDRQADLRATLLTPRVRRAFLAERDRFHGAFAATAQREWLGMGDADEGVDAPTRPGPPGDGEVLVFVAFYASDAKTRSLATRTSIWDVALVRGGVRVAPTSIEAISPSPAVSALFPFVDRFDDLYLLRFPLVDAASGTAVLGAGELALAVRSARADCVVRWSLVDR